MTDINLIRNQPWKRVVVPGVFNPSWYKVRRAVPVFITIKWHFQPNEKWELSITGVEGPNIHGNCVGSAGQCRDFQIHGLAKGWTFDMLERLRQIWERWHLNGMQADSPAQRDYLCEHPVTWTHPDSHYDAARRALAAAGLHPDPNFTHPTKTREYRHTVGNQLVVDRVADVPYEYGSAWLYEDVPDDVLEFLYHLPLADRAHPWGDVDRFVTTEEF